MRIIALGQQKGGVGKSAAAINLACQAIAHGESSAIIDMDVDQATALKWGKRRDGKPPAVERADVNSLPGVLKRLNDDGVQWVFVDLPGRSAPVAGAGLMASDLIIVPCRPLEVDIEASVTTIQVAIRGKKRYAFLMNIAPSQADKKRARQVSKVLAQANHPVIPAIIVQRTQVPDAIAIGKGVNEIEPDGPSTREFAELFTWLKENVK
jgi:chromosome partitioning protein